MIHFQNQQNSKIIKMLRTTMSKNLFESSIIQVHTIQFIQFNSFFCPICDKFFTEKRKIKPHIQRIHNKEKNYKCDLCSYSSFIRYDMTSHMKRIHFPTNDTDNK